MTSWGNVLVEAHRGYSAIAPENTLASISAGSGFADLTEWDVRVTADGALVLMHDSTVDRTTNSTGAVSSLTLAQIKTLDAGSWFSPAFAGEPVPTIAEAIDHALQLDITPLIEHKAGIASAYHSEFTSLELDPSLFRIISFDWSFLDGMHAFDPVYNLGALGSGLLTQDTIAGLKAQGIDFIDWNHSSITQSTVDLVHAQGMELHAWTVNDPARMQQLINFGVDGITTDLPETLSQLVISTFRTADLNMDNIVNDEDWKMYHAGRGKNLTGLSDSDAYQMGDMDGDFDNDIADFVRFKQLYFQSMNNLVAGVPQPIPEPTGPAWIAWSLLLLCGRYKQLQKLRPATAHPPVCRRSELSHQLRVLV